MDCEITNGARINYAREHFTLTMGYGKATLVYVALFKWHQAYTDELGKCGI